MAEVFSLFPMVSMWLRTVTWTGDTEGFISAFDLTLARRSSKRRACRGSELKGARGARNFLITAH